MGTAPAAPTHHSALLQDREQSLALHSEALLHPLKAGRLNFAVTAGTAPVCSVSCRLQLLILTSETAQQWCCKAVLQLEMMLALTILITMEQIEQHADAISQRHFLSAMLQEKSACSSA